MSRSNRNIEDDEFIIENNPEDYKPFVCDLSSIEFPEINNKLDFSFKTTIPYPKGIYGFQHYLHQSRQKLRDNINKFEGKKQVYNVCDRFYQEIDDYDKSINIMAEKYLGEQIISKSFYKLWEILCTFNLVNSDKIISCHLAEEHGAFAQAIMLFRKKYKSNNNDKHYCISLNNKKFGKTTIHDTLKTHKNVLIFDNYPKNFNNEYYGDLAYDDIRNNFINFTNKDKMDIITADNVFDWSDDVLQEQESFPIILSNCITALNIQKKSGHFICKFYENYTEISIKLILLMSKLYEKTIIFKPLTSSKHTSERFVIFQNFLDNKDKGNVLTYLDNILKEIMLNITKSTPKFINDYFLTYEIPKNVKVLFIDMSNYINNRVFQNVNEIVGYIKRENYRGDEYQSRREEQIKGSEYWIENYLTKDFNKLYDIMNAQISKTKKRIDELNKLIE